MGFAVLFGYHLLTGITPDRVFYQFKPLEFNIYWYGICIVGGIALGSYVVSRLVWLRGNALFNEYVPISLKSKQIATLKLPAEINHILIGRKIKTIGSLLLSWGFDFGNLGLNYDGIQTVAKKLEETPGVKKEWITNAPWRSWNPDHVWNGIIWALILGVIGARLYHILTPSPSMVAFGINSPLDYLRNPYQMINLRNGGLGIYGGIAGGALGLYIFARRQRIPALAWADVASIGLALGQVFGRWGNFFNQELYGRPTSLPWGLYIDHPISGYAEGTRFHPAFLYESLWSFLAFIVLITLYKRYFHKLRTGDLTALYLIFYAIGRILLETIRLDSRMVSFGGVTINMAIATLVSILVAIFMTAWRIFVHLRARGD